MKKLSTCHVIALSEIRIRLLLGKVQLHHVWFEKNNSLWIQQELRSYIESQNCVNLNLTTYLFDPNLTHSSVQDWKCSFSLNQRQNFVYLKCVIYYMRSSKYTRDSFMELFLTFPSENFSTLRVKLKLYHIILLLLQEPLMKCAAFIFLYLFSLFILIHNNRKVWCKNEFQKMLKFFIWMRYR